MSTTGLDGKAGRRGDEGAGVGSDRQPELGDAATAEEAATGADVVLLLKEWPQYTGLDPVALGAITHGRTIIDGRNALDPAVWRAAGWTYRGIGRP